MLHKILGFNHFFFNPYPKGVGDFFFLILLNRKNRKRFVAAAKSLNKKVVGYFFEVDFSVCQERNSKRARKVGKEVMESQMRRLEKPTKEEVDFLFLVREDGMTEKVF